MEARNIKQFDEKDEEIADALISLGMSRNAARTLSYLQNSDEATAVDLERGARLHQPEVSIAVKELKKRDWIDERENKRPGKGRPHKVYSLKIGFSEIITQLEKQHNDIVDSVQEKIERLKKWE